MSIEEDYEYMCNSRSNNFLLYLSHFSFWFRACVDFVTPDYFRCV